MQDNKLIATTAEGVIVKSLAADTDWFDLCAQARAWSGQNGVFSVAVIDAEGYFQALFVTGKQAPSADGLMQYQPHGRCHADHILDCGV